MTKLAMPKIDRKLISKKKDVIADLKKIVKPEKAVCLDEGDDPYLVVAADKGTATFSDIANEISIEKKHWLGDAFAETGTPDTARADFQDNTALSVGFKIGFNF